VVLEGNELVPKGENEESDIEVGLISKYLLFF
jgi:hypothetical protein